MRVVGLKFQDNSFNCFGKVVNFYVFCMEGNGKSDQAHNEGQDQPG